MRRIKKKINIFTILTIVFSLIFLFATFDIPSGDSVSTVVGPRFWPLMLLILLLVLSTLNLVISYLVKEKVEIAEEVELLSKLEIDTDILGDVNEESKSGVDQSIISKYNHWFLVAIVILYTILMGIVGFLIATIIFISVCAMLLGLRSKKQLIVTSLISSFVVYFIFAYLLNIPLP